MKVEVTDAAVAYLLERIMHLFGLVLEIHLNAARWLSILCKKASS